MKIFQRPWLMFVPLLLWVQIAQAGEVVVEKAWVRLPPPQSTAAAFLTIRNGTDTEVYLVGAESAVASRVEIHRSVVSDGVASMEEAPRVAIAAGETLTLAPKGMHLMLFEPGALSEGAEIPLELKFEPDQTIPARAEVRRADPGKHEGRGHHAHH